jgi:MtrB/PioB family decaheme-associated outer membrane protein
MLNRKYRMAFQGVLFFFLSQTMPAAAQQISGKQQDSEADTSHHAVGARPDFLGLNPFSRYTRSPNGLLYPEIWRLPVGDQIGEHGWTIDAAFEAGVFGTDGDTGTGSFLEYGDWDDGVTLQRFRFLLERPETGTYFQGSGSAVGRDDQAYRLSWGKYGSFELAGFFSAIPHVFSTNARLLWSGAGSGSLTLPASLTPANSTADQVEAAFSSIGPSTLALERERYGFSLRVTPSRRLDLFASASTEQRDGSRAFGGTFTYPFLGQAMEVAEPIDYTTTNLSAGLRFSGQNHQFNLLYSGSLFQNDNQELVWENPGLSPFSPFTPERGRYALAPDNDYHNLKADYGTNIGFWRGRFTATASYSRMRQDEALLPPTISSGVVTAGGTVIDLDFWNTVDALSQRSANAAIDHLLGRLRLVLQPARKLRLTGELRYRDEDNDTDYTAYNPLTDQYGYVSLDGGLAGIIATRSAVFDPNLPGSRVRVRNIPYEKDEFSAEIRGDYRLSGRTKIGLSLRRNEFDYAHRERSKIEDDIYRIELTQRGLLRGSLRLGYEYLRRDGDPYVPNPYEPFYSSSLPGFTPRFAEGQLPHTLSSLRKYDLADRDSHAADARLILVLTDAADLSLNARWEKDNLKADYGLRDAETSSANAEWNYRFAQNANVYLYYSYQDHERNIANINDAGAAGTDPEAGGAVYPLDNAWTENVDETNQSFGGGISREFDRFVLDLQYNYSSADSEFLYGYRSPGAFIGPVNESEIAAGFPVQRFEHHLLHASVSWLVSDDLSLRFFYRYEREDLDDFHFDGLTEPVVANVIYLTAIPQDFDVSVFGIFFEKSF